MQDASQPTLVRELIDMFLRESPAMVQRIADAQAAGDGDALRALAHRFLSTTQNIGALHLSTLCIEIERAARAGAVAEAAPLVAELHAARPLAHDALAAARLRY
jgi:HPt (histidine-containing phosphotransfer) domain-containing protein